jgi:ketosteroid isomerase-like protein
VATDRAERVRRGFEAMERGDVETLVADVAEDAEYVNPEYALEPGTRYGPDGARIALHNMLEAFDDLRWEIERLEERGDRVIATGTFTGRGKASGVPFGPQSFGVVLTYREDKVIRLEWFNDPEEALT